MKTPNSNAKDPNSTDAPATNRRELLAGAALAGLALPLAGTAAAAESGHHDHTSHGSHGGHSGPHHPELTKQALNCVGLGEACVEHCIRVMSTGDTSLTDCLIAVNAMLPLCATLARYAASDAKRLKELAGVCIDVCDDCAVECEKHADHHEECKVCGEACRDLITSLKQLTAA